MALHGQTLGHSRLLGVPQENTCDRPFFLRESEDWANEVLVDPIARAGIAAQASRRRGDQQVSIAHQQAAYFSWSTIFFIAHDSF